MAVALDHAYIDAMLISIVAVVVLFVGLLMWAISANPKVQRIGEWMFVIGLFWTVGMFQSHTVKLFP